MELPKPVNKEPLTVEVEVTLLSEARKQAKLNKLKMRQVVEFGLKAFLEKVKLK